MQASDPGTEVDDCGIDVQTLYIETMSGVHVEKTGATMSARKLTVTESAVFYLMLSLIKRFGGETYVKQGNVAARLGLARETVCRVIKRLKAKGLLKARQRSIAWHHGGRRLISSLYRLGSNWCDRRSQQRPVKAEKEEKWVAEHIAATLEQVTAVVQQSSLEGFYGRKAQRTALKHSLLR